MHAVASLVYLGLNKEASIDVFNYKVLKELS